MPYAHFVVSLGNCCDKMMYSETAKTERLTRMRIHAYSNSGESRWAIRSTRVPDPARLWPRPEREYRKI